MVAAIKQRVTVQPGGIVQVRSPELTPGSRAEVIVLVEQPEATPPVDPGRPVADWRRFAGAIDSGDPRSSDNDRIDVDLAGESRSARDPDQ